jgi:succinate dehydrogenase/fumarate reductase-like Fe-S protein
MLINGKIRFACREFLAEKLEIRAWQPGAVVRDLVVKEGHGMGKARGVRTTSITGDIRRGKPKLKPR